VQVGGTTGGLNEWRGNYWDDYQGFDRDGDGVGDTPYELYAFADQIWIELPPARFFKTAPVMELLDFLERLAPFSSPELTLKDAKPRVILFDTLMGKGVPFLETRDKNHFIRVDPPEWQSALEVLDQTAKSEGALA